MSVINQMLKDLDKRQSNETEVQADYPKISPNSEQQKRRPSVSFIIVVVLLVAISAYFWLTTQPVTERKEIIPTTIEAPTQASNQAALQKSSPATTVVSSQSTDNQPTDTTTEQQTVIRPSIIKAQTAAQAQQKETPVTTKASTAAQKRTAQETTAANINQPQTADNKMATKTSQQSTKTVKNSHISIAPTKASDEEIAQAKLKQAKALLNKGHFAKAESLLNDAIALKPDLHEARITLVSMRYGEQNPQAALALLQQGIQNFPDNPEYALLAARILLEQNRAELAWQVLQNQPPSIVMHPQFYQFKASLAQRREDWSSAYQIWQQLLDLNPQQGAWLLGAAIAADQLDKTDSAIPLYKQALNSAQLSEASLTFIRERLKGLGHD
ncbi:tetratricopeptide repeat protein [Catenovulum sediminis]|uniref:Tetratricopeptide repeat protein n=1 Tax=Catenovulum sediminis TaxID=1740262 RepID=A0ABV1RCX3_9ALTE|nr:tetratricopeptide repeat protein [Catenovulum sediminis]